MIIFAGRAGEDCLRTHGLDIPAYPTTGVVKYQGRAVGYYDDVHGMRINDNEIELCTEIVSLTHYSIRCVQIPKEVLCAVE